MLFNFFKAKIEAPQRLAIFFVRNVLIKFPTERLKINAKVGFPTVLTNICLETIFSNNNVSLRV